MTRTIKRFGWKPDLPDPRDLIFNHEEVVRPASVLPPVVSLRDQMPPVYDQAQLGSCVSNGTAAIMQRAQMAQSEAEGKNVPSRLFIYYNGRVIEGDPLNQDSGLEVRTGIKAVVANGAPPESDWPYSDADPGPFQRKPSASAYAAAAAFAAVKYQRILPARWPAAPFRSALAAGLPIVFGFPVPASFQDGSWDPTAEFLPLPGPSAQYVGGHCVVAVGYDFSRSRFSVPVFEIRNSWGSSWGDQGHYWCDFRWFNNTSLASDFWVIQSVT